jgi:hypothetical protein
LSQTPFLDWLKAVEHPPFDLIIKTLAMNWRNAS